MRRYARYLKERVDRDEIAGSTANTYWNYIAAFLSWCVYEELLAENPARKRHAEQELPDTRPRSDRQQFWNQADREALLAHLNDRAHAAVDEEGLNAIKELRDRALASLLAYSGVCSAKSSAIRTTSVGMVFAGVTSISKPERSWCLARIRPTRRHLSRCRYAIHSNDCTRHSVLSARNSRSFRRSTDRLCLERFEQRSLILGSVPRQPSRPSTNTAG